MPITMFFLVYMSLLAWQATRRLWRRARDPAATPAPRRLTNRQLISFGGRQLLFTAVLAIGWTQGAWTAASVGIPGRIDWLDTILAGEIGFLAVILAAGCTNIALQLGRANESARQFYRRKGYGERDGYELLDKDLD